VEYQDYYATLGVPRTATDKEIRTAYRKLARRHHPDVNPGNKAAEDRFKQINEAYEVLSDAEKRKKYDELGSRWREYEQWERAQAAGAAAGAAGGTGQGAQGGRPFDWEGPAGGDPGGVRYEYRTASDEDLRDLFGEDAPFSEFFETFFGSAGPAGSVGTGRTTRTARSGAGGRRASRRGRSGSDLDHPVEISLADAYRGTTVELALRLPDGRTRRLEVKIPPGVRTGSRVRIAGQGQPGEGGGQAGDLYLVVAVQPDPRFERRGDDLHTEVRAPFGTLVLGGEARVPTPDGRTLALTVPQGTQDGRIFRLRGQGMPRLAKPDTRGDLHAEVHARLPERLSPRERDLFEEFVRAETGAPTGAGHHDRGS
jgi:curved DNA-binding protein